MEKSNIQTKEPQYNMLFDVVKKHGVTKLGLMVNQSWNEDPKRTLFTLSRYKFVSRMLSGQRKVLEIGCADAFGTRIVQQPSSCLLFCLPWYLVAFSADGSALKPYLWNSFSGA